jgi:hypothetical protein
MLATVDGARDLRAGVVATAVATLLIRLLKITEPK